jgi:hypothetical protein
MAAGLSQTQQSREAEKANALAGKSKEELETLYVEMAGIEVPDDLKGDVDKLTAEIAKIQAAKQAGEEADKVF